MTLYPGDGRFKLEGLGEGGSGDRSDGGRCGRKREG